MVKVFVRVEFRRIRRQIKYLYPLWGGADQRPDLRQLVVPSPQGGVEVIAIGNPPLLPHSYKRAAVRSDFPPRRTVLKAWTFLIAYSILVNNGKLNSTSFLYQEYRAQGALRELKSLNAPFIF